MSHFFSQNHKKHLQIFQNSYSYPLFEKKHANPNGVIVLVDIENVHKPLKERENTLYPADFKKSLDEELKRDNPRSYISDIIAFGRKDILTQADVYNFDQQDIIFHDVPWRPSYCPSHLQDLHTSQRTSDRSDLLLIQTMILFGIDIRQINPKISGTILLITGDKDFATPMMDMRHRGFKILLGIRHPNTIELRRSADISWDILDMAQGPLQPPLRGNAFQNFPMKHPKARLTTGASRKRLTAVFWDMDKAPVSYSTTTKELWDKVSVALCTLGSCLYPSKIIGYGSKGSLKLLDEAPGAKLWEQDTVLRLVRKRELSCTYCGDVFQAGDAGPKEDKPELLLHQAMAFHCLDVQANAIIMVITSDPDFTFTMASLKKRNFTVILARPKGEEDSSEKLEEYEEYAHHVLDW